MNEKKINWDDYQLFLAVAHSGGLSKAARSMQTSPATLGRRMLKLEGDLDQELFIRHDRGYELTPQGIELLTKISDIDAQFSRLEYSETSAKNPLIKISAGSWTSLKLVKKFTDIIGSPADLRVRLVANDNLLSIEHREVAIGFRNQRPSERNLAGRKLCRVKFAPYAHPSAPDQWIKVHGTTPSARWMDRHIGETAFCEVNSPRNALDLAQARLGTVLLPTFIGDFQSELIKIGENISELSHEQWIVFHNDDRYRPAMRRAIERIYRIFQTP